MVYTEFARDGLPVAARERALTTTVAEWSPLVSEYARRDSASTGRNGKPCREIRWRVLPALGSTPLVVTVEVDRRLLCSPEVRVTCTGHSAGEEVLFPLSRGKSTSAMRER